MLFRRLPEYQRELSNTSVKHLKAIAFMNPIFNLSQQIKNKIILPKSFSSVSSVTPWLILFSFFRVIRVFRCAGS